MQLSGLLSGLRLHSLQSRFTALTVFLAILLAISSYATYLEQLSIKQIVDKNTTKREWLVKTKNIINSEIIDSYKSIDSFLLDPSNNVYQDWITSSLDNALENNRLLTESSWADTDDRKSLFNTLNTSLINLKKEITTLIEVRRDSHRQFPSLSIATTSMRPNRIRFINALSVALNELKASRANVDHGSQQQLIYDEFIQARYYWTQTLSNFRIYLANQFGAFDHLNLLKQEDSIILQYKALKKLLLDLKVYDDQGLVGFEASESLDIMLDSSEQWYQAFLKVKAVHHTDNWRADLKILKHQIQPLLDDISYLLNLLDEEVKAAAKLDLVLINSIINNQLRLLIILSVIAILVISLLTLLIKRMIFKPLQLVTSAIKAESLGNAITALPVVNAFETRELVDAFTEMRNQIHIRQDELEYQANHDSLTGLPNRKYFLEEINNLLEQSTDTEFSILLIDLNGFKDINDTLGHQVGDKILINVGSRLWAAFRETDIISRLGGDEYAILLRNTNKEMTTQILDKLNKTIDMTFSLEGINASVSMSIGAALYPSHGDNASVLLRHADVAMYTAKRQKQTYVFYKPSEDDYSLNKLSLSHDLKNSISSEGLLLHFQPKLCLNTHKIIGAEALIRWNHPTMGLISPDEFIPMAEQTGFINKITYWVIEEALITCQQWKRQGFDIKLSVNLSVYNLYDSDFVEIVRTLQLNYPDSARSIIFEITESAMMTNPDVAVSVLKEISNMGIEFSIDDYGTGFSSLSYLSQLAVNELKIDKSFVIDMSTDPRKLVIVRSTIDMAHNLNLSVVAEGVENLETMQQLEEYGCDHIQGYYLSKPVPESDFINWIVNYQEQDSITPIN